jgi:hypothetical protein
MIDISKGSLIAVALMAVVAVIYAVLAVVGPLYYVLLLGPIVVGARSAICRRRAAP